MWTNRIGRRPQTHRTQAAKRVSHRRGRGGSLASTFTCTHTPFASIPEGGDRAVAARLSRLSARGVDKSLKPRYTILLYILREVCVGGFAREPQDSNADHQHQVLVPRAKAQKPKMA